MARKNRHAEIIYKLRETLGTCVTERGQAILGPGRRPPDPRLTPGPVFATSGGVINTLGVAVPTSHHWPLGDEGKQAKKHRGVSGPPPYPAGCWRQQGVCRSSQRRGGGTLAGWVDLKRLVQPLVRLKVERIVVIGICLPVPLEVRRGATLLAVRRRLVILYLRHGHTRRPPKGFPSMERNDKEKGAPDCTMTSKNVPSGASVKCQ